MSTVELRRLGTLALTLVLATVGCGGSGGGSKDAGGGSAGTSHPDAGGGAGGVAGGGGAFDAGGGQPETGGDASASDTGDAGGAGGLAGDAGGGDADGGGPVEPIQFYGRWNRLADRAITVNSGSHVTATFNGTGLRARFDVSNNMAGSIPTLVWRIDTGAWQEVEVAATVMLAQGLSAGDHQVFLMARGFEEYGSRWTPPLVSSLAFLGFDVTGGALVPTPRPARVKIEFLGDSITEGVHVHDDRPGMTGDAWRADARLAYPTVTANTLGAEWRQVGFGRQGVTVVGNGGVPKAAEAFDWFYANVPRDAWQPDLVVINQGTNDAGAASGVFRPPYAMLLANVRKAYPAATIMALRPFGGAHASDIQAEVMARVTAGDSKIFYVDTTGWLGSGDTTDGTHPNEQGGAKAAQNLSAELRKHI